MVGSSILKSDLPMLFCGSFSSSVPVACLFFSGKLINTMKLGEKQMIILYYLNGRKGADTLKVTNTAYFVSWVRKTEH